MKVTNFHLYPNHTWKQRRLSLDDSTEASALVHPASREGVFVRPGAMKFRPAPIVLLPKEEDGKTVSAWDQLLSYPDPKYTPLRKVSRWAFLNGDNPFLLFTSAGCILPMPDQPGIKATHKSVMEQCSEIEQEAIDSKGMGAALRQRWMLAIQVILAGVVALSAIVGVIAMLPKIMEGFSK